MNDAPTTLPSYCPKCGRAVSLMYVPDDGYRVQRWICPHVACEQTIRMAIGGKIQRALSRYEPDVRPGLHEPKL